jgi:hypothetical protein
MPVDKDVLGLDIFVNNLDAMEIVQAASNVVDDGLQVRGLASKVAFLLP